MEEVSSVREEISSVRKEGAEARVKMKEQFGLQPDFSQEPTLGMYTACALRVRCVCAACALRVRCVCAACALHMHCVCTACVPPVSPGARQPHM